MTYQADLGKMLEPLEEFGRLHAKTIRRFGPKAIDLSYPSPRICYDTRAYQLLSELASQASVDELQYPPFGGLTHAWRHIASALSARCGITLGFRDITLTPGGAAALHVTFRALFTQGDQVMLVVPFWMDYPVYLLDLGISPITVPSQRDKHLDLAAVEAAWTPATRGIIISQPACPTGVVYTEKELAALAALLSMLGKKYGTEPVLVSDEVHRDTVWGGARCASPPDASWSAYDEMAGRFAVARRVGDTVVLARDALGLNKLLFAIHEHRGVVAGNYLADLLVHGVPFEAIYAVPAGSVTEG
jgi:aspartate aminotransferase